MSSLAGKVYVCGDMIPDIRILDLTPLEEIDRIPTERNKLFRFVSFDSLNSEANAFVVSGFHHGKNVVSLFNFETKECLGQINDVAGYNGLESLSLSSNPIIVCGGFGRKVSAYDFFSENENKCLMELENSPTFTFRICCFPEWSKNEVFVAGRGEDPNGGLSRYDVNRGGVRLGSYVGHVGSGSSVVYGLTASLSDGILISGSMDDFSEGTLKLWSKDNYECIESVSLDHECNSLIYSSENHLICCGTEKEIEIWDTRNMSERVRKVDNVGSYRVHDLDQIPSRYSSSVSNDSLFVSGSGEFVSIWNPITGKILQKHELDDVDGRSYVYGLRILPFSLDESQEMFLNDFDELVSFIIEQFGEWSGVCWIRIDGPRIDGYFSSSAFRIWKSFFL